MVQLTSLTHWYDKRVDGRMEFAVVVASWPHLFSARWASVLRREPSVRRTDESRNFVTQKMMRFDRLSPFPKDFTARQPRT